jgi:hypothetical protein
MCHLRMLEIRSSEHVTDLKMHINDSYWRKFLMFESKPMCCMQSKPDLTISNL